MSNQISKDDFRQMSLQIVDSSEVDLFVENVFRLFDANRDRYLDFEEFTMATSTDEKGKGNKRKKVKKKPIDKLTWIYENIYDKVNYIFLKQKY